jgi:hypothetical protein
MPTIRATQNMQNTSGNSRRKIEHTTGLLKIMSEGRHTWEQFYWAFGFCPLSCILTDHKNTFQKLDVSILR